MQPSLQKWSDYMLALLEFLQAIGGSGHAAEICQRFELQHRSGIPQNHYEALPSDGAPRWKKHVEFARYHLRQRGFVDAPQRGIWKLSETGRQWLEGHKAEPWDIKRDALSAEGVSAPATPRRTRRVTSAAITRKPGLSYEDLVEVKKHLPADKFDQIFGPAWEAAQRQRMAQLVTQLDERKLVTLVREKVRQIQDIVLGKIDAPSEAELCGSVEFCYRMELFKEGVALFQRIEPNSVDEAIYSRAKKIADTCRLKLQVD